MCVITELKKKKKKKKEQVMDIYLPKLFKVHRDYVFINHNLIKMLLQ